MANPIQSAFKPNRAAERGDIPTSAEVPSELASATGASDSDEQSDGDGDSGGDAGTKGTGSAG